MPLEDEHVMFRLTHTFQLWTCRIWISTNFWLRSCCVHLFYFFIHFYCSSIFSIHLYFKSINIIHPCRNGKIFLHVMIYIFAMCQKNSYNIFSTSTKYSKIVRSCSLVTLVNHKMEWKTTKTLNRATSKQQWVFAT